MSDRKSTYKEFADDILLDLANEPKLNGITDEMIQHWVNRSTQTICRDLDIEDETEISLTPLDRIYDLSFFMREIGRIKKIQRVNSQFKQVLEEKTRDGLLALQQEEGPSASAHTALDSPSYYSVWMEDDHRYIEFYPAATARETVKVYFLLDYSPRDHHAEDLTSEIFLIQKYEPVLRDLVKAEIFGHLGNEDKRKFWLAAYEHDKTLVNRDLGRKTRISMTYR